MKKIEIIWPGVLAPDVLDSLDKVKSSRSERWVDWWLAKIGNKQAIIGILALFTTPGPFRRVRYILETIFPSPTYLVKYYGPAPLGFWPLLYPWRLGVILFNLVRVIPGS